MRPKPKWQYFDEASGAIILPDLYYGFSDSGGISQGKPTQELALNSARLEFWINAPEPLFHGGYDANLSTQPKDLGVVLVCVLKGEEYLKELQDRGIAKDLGHFI